jgi:hypothetical protein
MTEETSRIDLILYCFIFSILRKEKQTYAIRKRKKNDAGAGQSN